MLYFINKNFNILSKKNKGEIFFLLGIFLLPAAFPLGSLFLLISLIISFFKNSRKFLNDRSNYPVFLAIGIILISTINTSLINIPEELINYQKSSVWLNLFNWIPILLGYLGFQDYLNSNEQKINFAKYLIAGTVPVIVSCFVQYNFYFKDHISILNGLLIWFMKTPAEGSAVSGLFSNPNYLVSWLIICLPFSLLLIKVSKKNSNQIILFIISVLFTAFLILTNSRNGFLGLIVVIISFFGIKRFLLFILPIASLSYLTNLLLMKIANLYFFKWFLSNEIVTKIINSTFDFQTNSRIQIWESAISFINEKPFLGWGASTFPYLHQYYSKTFSPPLWFEDAQHSHNIFLEMAHNFGLPFSLLISISILFLISKVLLNLKKSNNYEEYLISKLWITSTLGIILIHLTDMTYYDGKISLLICILFAGLKSSLGLEKSAISNIKND